MADKVNNQDGDSQNQHDNTGKGVGISGQQPGHPEGPVAGGADNTRGENVSSREGGGAGAKTGKARADSDYPQGTHANPSTSSRGADSADKEFRNNQQEAG